MSNRENGRVQQTGSPSLQDAFQRALLENLYDGVYFVDAERRITFWNRSAEELTGFKSEEMIGKLCCNDYLAHVDQGGCSTCADHCPLSTGMQKGQPQEVELYLRHKRGHRVPVSVRVIPIFDDFGCSIGAAEIFSDVKRTRGMDRRILELEQLVYRDFLTGLANRHYTYMKVQQAAREMEELGRNYGLLMIDLDDFKQVNDQYGHTAGDDLLKAVSQTLNRSVRSVDTVGRWGGDEFLVVIADATPGVVYELGNRCRRLIAHSDVMVGSRRLCVSASVGGCLMRENESVEAAVARTDALMYLSKKSGGNRASVDFAPTIKMVSRNGHDGSRFNLVDPPIE
jgi:diguanylate cyclase (GGDEF)-like protein/PAS domain S-box-containing protein